MRAVFWIEELVDLDARGNPHVMSRYAQRGPLDFFPIPHEDVRRIGWPHISINTMKLISPPTS